VIPMGSPTLMNLAAVAEALAVSPHTIRMWVRQGKLRPVRICRRLLFEPVDVERFVSTGRSAVPNSDPAVAGIKDFPKLD
jgi:excisionase family DNA binding protein